MYEIVKRLYPKYITMKKYFFHFFLCLYEMMHVHKTYFSNHFMMYASQISMLYTLYSDVCQLHLNKTRRKKKNIKYLIIPKIWKTYTIKNSSKLLLLK